MSDASVQFMHNNMLLCLILTESDSFKGPEGPVGIRGSRGLQVCLLNCICENAKQALFLSFSSILPYSICRVCPDRMETLDQRA